MCALHTKTRAPKLDVTVISKGAVGRSGCTRMVQGGFNAVLDAADSLDLMLAVGLLHGATGINAALHDYSPGRRRALRAGLVALTITLFAFGSIVIARGAGI